MRRLLLISNRLPITLEKRKGNIQIRPSVGGLATGLGSFYKSHNSIWIGWCGIPSENLSKKEREEIQENLLNNYKSYSCFLSKKDIRNFYYGFCNKTIWPLFHYFSDYVIYEMNLWESYKHVNQVFCNEVLKIINPTDTIWIHDYQLMLLPKLIREKMPTAQIGFFLHIPFPSFEIFRLLPWRKEILNGLLGADLIGFHTDDYVRHFLISVRRLLGYEHNIGQITTENRLIKVDVFPMGIDYGRFADAHNDPVVRKEINKIQNTKRKGKIILSVDRLDYTKGILHRLEAFDLFLDENPEFKEKVTLILIAVPSRTGVEDYMLLKKRLDEYVGRINGKHGTINWVPIWYLYRFLPFHTLTAFYNVSDVALITPLRDGMNLIAKEYLATRMDGKGVLILSEMAGAVKELGEAIIVNPNDVVEVAKALKKALTLPEEEQIARNKVMQKRLERYNVERWANDFLERLSQIKNVQDKYRARNLSENMKNRLIQDYSQSEKRLLLLDYDGTLVPFAEMPEKAKPDKEILDIIRKLTEDEKNEVVIVSGRDKDVLEKWFGKYNLGLVAEHGVWIKKRAGLWSTIKPLQSSWKDDIRPILSLYVDRTPGSFLEEKDFSLVWHYRNTSPDLASARIYELKDNLALLIENLNLGVLEGDKVIEIKNPTINKGEAVSSWVSEDGVDFILAIGDDLTDEDMFAELPESAYSIKVGISPSMSRFNLDSPIEVRLLLKELTRI